MKSLPNASQQNHNYNQWIASCDLIPSKTLTRRISLYGCPLNKQWDVSNLNARYRDRDPTIRTALITNLKSTNWAEKNQQFCNILTAIRLLLKVAGVSVT